MGLNIRNSVAMMLIVIIGMSAAACSKNEQVKYVSNDSKESQEEVKEDKQEEVVVKEEESVPVIKEMSEEEALEICKNELEGIWDWDVLKLGSNEYGLEKIVYINGVKYYGIYFIDTDGIVGDFRYLVDSSSGEVFFQTSANLVELIPIEEYKIEFGIQDSATNGEFTAREAIELTLEYFGLDPDEVGDGHAMVGDASIGTRLEEPMYKDGELYHQIELRLPNSEGRHVQTDYWYVSNSGNVYGSSYGFGDTASDITSNLVPVDYFDQFR